LLKAIYHRRVAFFLYRGSRDADEAQNIWRRGELNVAAAAGSNTESRRPRYLTRNMRLPCRRRQAASPSVEDVPKGRPGAPLAADDQAYHFLGTRRINRRHAIVGRRDGLIEEAVIIFERRFPKPEDRIWLQSETLSQGDGRFNCGVHDQFPIRIRSRVTAN
jgi:hypothetical protein